MGFSNILADEDIGREEFRQYIGIINQSSNRLLQIINDIISISSIETGIERVNEHETDLFKELESLCSEYEDTAASENLTFSCICGLREAESVVLCDWQKLSQVIGNLIRNAVRFTGQGKIELSCKRKGDRLCFSVSDTGIGIHPEHHEVIFERFRQVAPEKGKVVEGNGLGLTISKSYVELMEGEMSVFSEPGKGSVFSFHIPYKSAKKGGNQNEADKESKKQPDREYVLLVAEDEPSNYLLIVSMLESYPYRLIHAVNGADAVSKCRENPDIDMIIMDIKMPVMGGLEATRTIKEENPGIPVLAVTAHALEGDRDKAMGAGCDDYLSKPISKAALVQKVSDLLG